MDSVGAGGSFNRAMGAPALLQYLNVLPKNSMRISNSLHLKSLLSAFVNRRVAMLIQEIWRCLL
jgi:hypothetical protein